MVGLTPLEAAELQEHCNPLGSADARRAPSANPERVRFEPEVAAKISGIENALGFILWMKDGYIDLLKDYKMALKSISGADLAALDFELESSKPKLNSRDWL